MPYCKPHSLFILLCLLLLLLSPAALAEISEDSKLDVILTREWKKLNAEHPILAIYLGEETSKLWPDNSHAARLAQDRHYTAVLTELDKLDESAMSPQQQVNLQLFRQQLSWQGSLHEHRLDLFTMNQREGIHTLATLSDSLDVRDLGDLESWVQRLEAFEQYTRREIVVLSEAIKADRVQPQIITQRMIDRVSVQPELHRHPAKSPFFKPFLEASPDLRARPGFENLRARAKRAIRGPVLKSFEELLAFLQGPYLAASPKEVGLGRLDGGQAAYQFLISRYTTTEYTPDEIHQLGLSEVARIRTEMESIKETVGFTGSLEEFFEHLRTDPKYYVDDPQELLRRYRAFCKKVDGKMPTVFKSLPRKPYGVEPIPDYIAPATTTAYYLPGSGRLAGTYFVNLYKPETRALFEIPALSLHEAVPGHHHQIALAQELPALPAFRRESSGFGDYTVFVEGWALYAESLGEEMGLYTDPYDKFGRYTYEMWRAIRLVLDTGLHSKGWTRAQAIDYFLNNSPRSQLDITNEVDRYISWPGQALAYKMGELEIKRLRKQATKALGEDFDLPSFHDAILKQGAVPLQQLEKQVSEYIEEKKLALSQTR